MTVAELIEKLQSMDPDAQVRLEADFDGMTGSGDLAHVEYDDDGAVLLRDDRDYDAPCVSRQAFTLEADGEAVGWSELREITSIETGRAILPGEPSAATLTIDVDAQHFPAGETRAVKLTGHDGREFYATCVGEDAGPGVTRISFPLPPWDEAPPPDNPNI